MESISDHVPSLDALEVAALDRRMDKLKETFLEAQLWRGRLEKSRSEVEALYGSDSRSRVEIFNPFHDEVQLYLDALALKVDECLNYRRRPFEALLADTNADVPRKFVSSANANALNGLVGDAYLPRPLILGEYNFSDRFYQGYAMRTPESGNCLVPVLSGVAQSESGEYSPVRGDTPEELLSSLLSGSVTYSLPGTGSYKNGTLVPPGADDPHYYVAENNDLPAQVIEKPSPELWGDWDDHSQWIWQNKTGTTPLDVTLRFDTYFNISDADYFNYTISLYGKVSSDDYLTDIFINDVRTGNYVEDQNFFGWKEFEVDSGFKVGRNKLSFSIKDVGIIAGVRVTGLELTIQGKGSQEGKKLDGGIETKSCSATIPEIPPNGDDDDIVDGSPSLAPTVAYAMAFFASSSMLLL